MVHFYAFLPKPKQLSFVSLEETYLNVTSTIRNCPWSVLVSMSKSCNTKTSGVIKTQFKESD